MKENGKTLLGREDNKITIFKETEGDDWCFILIFEDLSCQESKKGQKSFTGEWYQRRIYWNRTYGYL